MSDPPTTVLVSTPDGRALQVHEAGDPHGYPVVVHHGSPSCGLLLDREADLARDRGLRLIGFDRAGYGGSDRHRGRMVGDVAVDVAAILDALALDRFVTWGGSGGGPHALACAALLPDRCCGAVSVSGTAPFDAEGLDWLDGMGETNVAEFVAAAGGEDALLAYLGDEPARLREAAPEDLAPAWSSVLSEVDAAVLTGENSEISVHVLRHALAPGAGGWIDDDLAFLAGWGFDVRAIDAPVEIWHGRHDLMVPPAHAHWLAEAVPGARLAFFEDEGHVSLRERQVEGIYDAVARYTF